MQSPRSIAAPGNFTKTVFGFCGVGLNVTFAIYLAYVKVYGAVFSKTVLLWMNASIYIAATGIVGMQMFFDKPLDEQFSCKVTYSFRICMGLLVMALTLFLIPFASSVAHVYAFGVFIGIFEGGPLSSLQQLAAVVSADMSKYVNTGFSIAQVLPIGLSLSLGFYDADASRSVALAFAWVPMAICLVGPLLFFVLLKQGALDGSFQVLDKSLLHDEPDAVNRQESLPLVSSSRKQSTWSHPHVLGCAILQVVTYGLAMFLMPFLTFFGSAELAHILVLIRFGAELLGRLFSHLWGLEWWGAQTSFAALSVLSALAAARTFILVLLLLHLSDIIDLSRVVVACLVALFYGLFAWTQSELMTSIVELGPPKKQASLVRGMMFLGFAAQLFAICLALPVIEHSS